MARQKLPPEKLAAAEHLFMSGMGIREVAAEIGIGQRQCANAAKAGNWASIRQRKGIPAVTQRTQAVEVVQKAARTHLDAVETKWRMRLTGMMETVAETSERISDLLAREAFADATAWELTNMLRAQVDVLARLETILAGRNGAEPPMQVHINIDTISSRMTPQEALAVYQQNLRGEATAPMLPMSGEVVEV